MDNPWYPKISEKLDKLYTEKLRTPKGQPVHDACKKYRNMYIKIKRVSKQLYFYNILERYKKYIKITWKAIRPITGKSHDKSCICTTFNINNNSITDRHVISNEFCKFFSNVGKTYAAAIPDVREKTEERTAKKFHVSN